MHRLHLFQTNYKQFSIENILFKKKSWIMIEIENIYLAEFITQKL